MTKTAVITGASSGIGEEFANQLAEQNYNLIINSRSEEKLQQIAEHIRVTHGVKVNVVTSDLTTDEGIQKVIDVISSDTSFDLLVNNAGFGLPKQFLDVPYERHQDMIDLHVTAVTKLSYFALKLFKEKGEGGIITVSSMAAFIGSGMYSGTKGFQVKLSKRLAKIVKNTNIKIQVLCPGYVKTQFHFTDDYEGIDARGNIPSWLWLEKEDVVSYSLKKFSKGKIIVVPSWKYKLMKFLGWLGLIKK